MVRGNVLAVGVVSLLTDLSSEMFAVREIVPAAAPTSGPGAGAEGLPRRLYGFVAAAALFALGNSSDLFLLLYAHERFGHGLGQLIALWVPGAPA